MATTPVTLDLTKAIPIGGADTAPDPAGALQGAVSYGASQDPDQYAHRLDLQKKLGIPPVVTAGNEKQVQQAADVNSIDYPQFAAANPRTTAWASNPDNAAVSGVDEIHRVAGIEQNAAAMRAVPDTAKAGSFWSEVKDGLVDAITHPLETLVGADTPAQAAEKRATIARVAQQTGDPFLGSVNAMEEANQKPLINVTGSAWFQRMLDPKSRNVFSRLNTGGAKSIEALSAPDNLSLLASLPFAPEEASAVISGVFSAQMGEGAATGAGATIRAAYRGDYGDAAEAGAGALISAAFAVGAGSHALSDRLTAGVAAQEAPPEAFPGTPAASPYLDNLAQAVSAAEQSKLRERAPDKFNEAMQTLFAGDQSLRVPVEQFGAYFKGKGMDPAGVASDLGSSNYTEAALSGGDVEIPKADFLAKLDQEHQKGLLEDVVDPATGLTARQHQESAQDLQQWAAGGGAAKLAAETAAADAETASTPEYAEVKEQLLERYVNAGETPEVAETLATKDANAYSNLARGAGMKPAELLNLYNPKVTLGEAPEGAGEATEGVSAADAGESTASEVLKQSQPDSDQPRGWFKVSNDGRSYEIGKTKFGDLSTFVHEPAHAYLNILGDLVDRKLAGSALTRDYKTVRDWLGAKDGEDLTREQQETWARANEQYLREGKPPSPGLKGAFQRFAIWLGSVYRKASDLGVDLSDDIRGVFDRMYAAEEGVNKAEREAGPKLFNSPEEAGWTSEEFNKYAEANNMTAEKAKGDLLARLNDAAVRERTEAWRDEEKNVRTAVTAEVDQRPEYSAIRALRKGELPDGTEITLDRDQLVKQFGEERVKALQQAHPGLYRNEGGEEPELVAEVLGYKSAADMMKALELAPRRSAAIEAATRDYMTAKHGDIRYDGTLDDQARIALENDKRSDSLYNELRALKQKVAGAWREHPQAMRSVEVAPIASYREAAEQMVEKKAVADLNPTRYLDASRKYSREAFDALRAGDAQKAANAKHKELMNHFLFREATKAKEYVTKFEAYAKRVQKPAAQGQLGLAGADYQDQFNRILGRYGLGPMPGPAERTLAEWASSEYDKGKEPAIDPVILNESRTLNYRSAAVAEIRQVHDALINVRKLASLELGMTVNGKRIEFNSAIAGMDAQARESLPTKPSRVLKGNATLGEKVGDYVQRGDAMLMRTERLMEWLDGGKTGPWHDNLWNLAADSQGNEYKLQEQVTRQLGDALENMPKEQRAKMLDKVTVDGIPETVTRHDLVSMAMNMGNDGNLDRLQKTFIAHGWEPYAIGNIAKMLTAEEWKFVQASWDSLKPLGQAQSELERRLTGLPPVMVKPTPLDMKLNDGTEIHLAGGYYPVVMDPRFSARGAAQDAGTTAQNLMEAGYGRAATSRGNMKERTGFGGPLQLDYEQVLTQHTAKVIKDITHREFMLAANKLLTDTQVRKSMRETLGEGYEEKMMPWLRTIINDRNGSAVQGLGDFSRLMRSLRTNLTLATLSYKVSTSLLQWTHAPRMLLSTNPGSYAQAMVDFLAHPQEMTEQIRGLSPNEMAGRGENLDRDVRAVLKGDPGIQRTVARVGNVSIKYTDHVLSFPLWLSVYRDALKEHAGLEEDRAQYLATHAADSAVRLGLGSAAPKDLPPIMRNNDLSKLFTMFYSFHNGIYGQVRDIGHQFKQNGGAGKLTYGLAMSVLVPAVLGGMVSGNGPKDDENKGLWAAKRALLFGADTVPLVRDAASALDSDGEVKNPLMNVLTKGTKATQEALSDSTDKDWNGIGLNYLEVGGDLAGVPGTTQALKPLRYMNQVQKGNVDNPNVWDAVAGSGRR